MPLDDAKNEYPASLLTLMPSTTVSDAYRDFMVNKPNPPEHAAFMAAAAREFPSLPPGAQQAALHTLYTLGKGYAKRYAANALARQSANERALIGCTLGTWRATIAAAAKPYRYAGIPTPARRREYKAAAARFAEYMAAGREAEEGRRAAQRKDSNRKLAAGLRAVGCDPREYIPTMETT